MRLVLALLLPLLLWGSPARAEDPPAAVAGPTSFVELPVEVLAPGLDPEQFAELRFLGHLGWRVLMDPSATGLRIERGNPWAAPTLEASQAAGDLRILLPAVLTPEIKKEFATSLEGVAESIPSRAAWKFRLEIALKEATRKLAAAERRGQYSFPEVLGIGLPFFTMKAPEPEWMKEGRVLRARDSARAAVEAIYERQSVVECYSGQWMAIYASQYELYGPEWFDQVFRPEDLVIGRPDDIKKYPVGTFSRHELHHEWRALVIPPEWKEADPAYWLTRFGPRAFAGVTGILLNQDPDAYSNENFMIVSASERFLDEIREAKGLHAVARAATEAWKWDRQASGWFNSASVKAQGRLERERILSGPLFTELIVYCHPYGVVPLREIVEKKMGQNATPIYLLLYTHGVEDALYQRYRHAWKRRHIPGYGT